MGLFVWYLFPKHPTRSIVQLPSERVAVSIDTPITTKSEKLNAYSPPDSTSSHNFSNNNEEKVGKLIDFDDHHMPQISATAKQIPSDPSHRPSQNQYRWTVHRTKTLVFRLCSDLSAGDR